MAILPLISSAASALLPSSASGASAAAGAGKPKDAKEAATQFEGLLIEEMLQSAHQANPGSLSADDSDDSQSDTIFGMASQQFAQVMAKQGGFGLAKIVDQGIARQQSSIDAKHTVGIPTK